MLEHKTFMSLQKILKLAKKTGERLIIMDESLEEGFVVIPLSEYERLVGEAKSPGLGARAQEQCQPVKNPEPRAAIRTEHKITPTPVRVEVRVAESPPQQGEKRKISQNLEEEEKFYLEPLS